MDILYVFYIGEIIRIVDGVFYTNTTQIGCIDFDVGFGLAVDSVTISKDQKSVLQSLYTGGDDVLLTFGNFTDRIINYNINRLQGEFSFCINNTTIYDGGDYYYERTNEVKITERLYVLDKPTQPDISIITNGIVDSDKGHLVCKSLSNSMPNDLPLSYYWTINNTMIVPNDKYSFMGSGNSQLIVYVVRNDRFNTIRCYSAEKQGLTSDKSTIIRIDPKHKPTQPDISVISNGTVNSDKGHLECKSLSTSAPSDLPLAYYWKINQTVIVPNDKYRFFGPGNSQLIVDVGRNDRFNMFVCYSAEQQGMTSYGSTIMRIDPKHSPIVTIQPNIAQYRIIVHSRFIIRCESAEAYPNVVSYEWFKEYSLIPGQITDSYTINNVSKTDDGIYNCTASNGYGTNGSASISLIVLYGPIVKPMSMIAQEEGRNVTVYCDVQSNPTATNDNVAWTKTGNSTFRQNGLQLTIPSVNKIDHGTFTCTVMIIFQPTDGPSIIRSSAGSIQINVLFVPTPEKVLGYDGPFIDPMSLISQEIGRPLNIRCDVKSNPTATNDNITWTKDGNSTFRRTGINMTIYSLNKADQGSFICTVRITSQPTGGPSVMRTTSAPVQINVLCIPKNPEAVLAICEFTSAFIIWKSLYNGGSEQKFHIQYWEREQTKTRYMDSSNISDLGEHFYMHIKLDGLAQGKKHGFQIIAQNYIGQSISQNLTCSMDSTLDREGSDSFSREDEVVYKTGIASLAIGILMMLSTVVANVVLRIRKTVGKETSRLDVRTNVNSPNAAFQDSYEAIEQNIATTDPHRDSIDQLGSSLGTYEDVEPKVKRDLHVYQQLQECQKGNIKTHEYANMNF